MKIFSMIKSANVTDLSNRIIRSQSVNVKYRLQHRYFIRQRFSISFVQSLKLFSRERDVSQNADQAALLIRDEIQEIFICESTRLWIFILPQSAFCRFKRHQRMLSRCFSRYDVFPPSYFVKNESLIKGNLHEYWWPGETSFSHHRPLKKITRR